MEWEKDFKLIYFDTIQINAVATMHSHVYVFVTDNCFGIYFSPGIIENGSENAFLASAPSNNYQKQNVLKQNDINNFHQ